MIDPQSGHQHLADGAAILAASDPIRAVNVLASALREQSIGAQEACVRVLAETLSRNEPRHTKLRRVADDLRKF